MAYVPNAAHDVFVSYAHNDNDPLEGESGPGWVDHLSRQLSIQLDRRLGSTHVNKVDVWTDRKLALNMPLTPELTRQVSNSALLLVVMSPSYVNSDWCGRERQAFLKVAQTRLAEGRVFIVRNLDVDRSSPRYPAEFGDHDGRNFYVNDLELNAPRTLDPQDTAFKKLIGALSNEMAKTLATLAAEQHRPPAPGGAAEAAPAADIFLARSTDDLEDREEDLRNYLVQASLRVTPRRIYAQSSREDFESAVRAQLRGCRLFVQLLSASRGPEMPFETDRRLPALLHELGRASGIRTLCWRDRALKPETITDDEHRRLVEDAIACPIEEFKRRVVQEGKPEPPRSAGRVPHVSGYVFVDRDRDDRKLAEQVAQELQSQGVSVYFPLDTGTPEQIREDMERFLSGADGVLLVFGASELPSVREHLRRQTRVLSQRETAPAALAVFEGPPGEREKLEQLRDSCRIPDMLVIDGSGGITAPQLAPFIERLRRHAAQAAAR